MYVLILRMLPVQGPFVIVLQEGSVEIIKTQDEFEDIKMVVPAGDQTQLLRWVTLLTRLKEYLEKLVISWVDSSCDIQLLKHHLRNALCLFITTTSHALTNGEKKTTVTLRPS